MSDTNAFASLSPTLLARKGGAKPAMRRQMASSLSAFDGQAARDTDEMEDLGWNDMGEDEAQETTARSADVLSLTPEPANPDAEAETRVHDKASAKALVPEVVKQQETIAERVAEKPVAVQAVPAPKRARRSALARGKRAAFTLRLDADRHLKLKLASTMKNRSAQQLVTEALDQLLENMPDLGDLAAQVKRR
ncbi:hypothetical protein [Altererythrobacter sp. ZODW24]|uniref:hypothetical protein n=1 Tax=Altererythrobacter sp. ZODW24 TaxID=2185142 RepID=UPI000DF7FB8D|nr:hypothetical protein [Altererythrobacter sp. ZODW24]